MRESFGGAFMLKVALVFVIIYVSFMAIAVNYAKAFRVKNQVINILEQGQYAKGDYAKGDSSIQRKIDSYLESVAYNVDTEYTKSNCSGEYIERGVCIVPHCDDDVNQCYFSVITYISIKDFPFFKNLRLTLPIRGETKTIVYY